MSLAEQFQQAADDVKQLSKRPTNEELLDLYAFYKQGSEGDVSGKKPGMLDVKGRAKYDAWEKRKGMNKEEAMQKYVDYVERLRKKYS